MNIFRVWNFIVNPGINDCSVPRGINIVLLFLKLFNICQLQCYNHWKALLYSVFVYQSRGSFIISCTENVKKRKLFSIYFNSFALHVTCVYAWDYFCLNGFGWNWASKKYTTMPYSINFIAEICIWAEHKILQWDFLNL